MMNELKELLIDGAKYNYDPDTEYIKDGHAYCKVCNERKDGEVMDIFGSKKIFKRQCECCLLYTSPSPRDRTRYRMPSSA